MHRTQHNHRGEHGEPAETYAECLDVGQDVHLVVALNTDDIVQQVELHSQRKNQAVKISVLGRGKVSLVEGRGEGGRGASTRQNAPRFGRRCCDPRKLSARKQARAHRVLFDVVARLGVGDTEEAGEGSESILHHRYEREGQLRSLLS